MPNYVILTEKPSARKHFEQALGGSQGQFADFHYQMANLRGHVVALKDPEEQVPAEYAKQYASWDLKHLPWDLSLFKWVKAPIRSRNPYTKKSESTKSLLDTLKKQVAQGVDAIVIATDHDPSGEGELLAWEALFAIGWKGTVLRAYFMDESPASIQKALRELHDISDSTQDGDLQKGTARSQWDFASMQLTRIATKAAKAQGFDLVSRQGRLKSAMLWHIYQQLEAIKAYQRVPFYEVRYQDDFEHVFKRSVPKSPSEEPVPFRHATPEAAAAELAQYQQSGVTPLPSQRKTQAPPQLLDLSALSARLGKFGFSAQEVLSTYQKMYDAQIVSYPRTEDKTITPEQFQELLPKADQIASLLNVDPSLLQHRQPRKTHVKAQGAHGANRPGPNVPRDLSSLSQYGASGPKIYEILGQNFLAMLANDYVYEIKHACVTDHQTFKSQIHVPIELNWRLIFQTDAHDEDLSQHQAFGPTATPFIFEGENPKPVHPNWKWLQAFLAKHDIGTGATRTSTYAELSSGKGAYIKDTKGKIDLTKDGAVSAYLVKDTYIANPKITKRVFDIFKQVGEFTVTHEHALKSITMTVEHDLPIIVHNAEQLSQVFGAPKPKPKRKVVKKDPADQVTGTWNGQAVTLSKQWGNHRFTEAELTALFAGETIRFDTTTKQNKPYTAQGKLTRKTYKGNPYVGFGLIRDKKK